MTFRLPIEWSFGDAALVRQGSTADENARQRESYLSDRIPFRWAEDLFHAPLHTRLRGTTRLTGFLPVSAKAGAGTFHNDPLNRSEWRTEMQRGVQGRFLAPESNESEARGCERLERELWAGDFPLTVWPTCNSRSLSGVSGREAKRCGSIPGLSFMQTNTECPRGVLRSSRSLTTRFSPSGTGSEVQYRAST